MAVWEAPQWYTSSEGFIPAVVCRADKANQAEDTGKGDQQEAPVELDAGRALHFAWAAWSPGMTEHLHEVIVEHRRHGSCQVHEGVRFVLCEGGPSRIYWESSCLHHALRRSQMVIDSPSNQRLIEGERAR